jgi:hypothetical protein
LESSLGSQLEEVVKKPYLLSSEFGTELDFLLVGFKIYNRVVKGI